jgi:hypothetical protein
VVEALSPAGGVKGMVPLIDKNFLFVGRSILSDLLCVRKIFPGAAIAVQTFGDFLGFNPHCHILVTDGCFLRQAQDNVYGDKGMFRVAPPLELKKLEAIFRHKVFRMLLNKGKITKDLIAMLSSWRHSGFQVFCGNRPSTSSGQAQNRLAQN